MGGTRLRNRSEFKHLFERRIAQVINSDPAHVGGISKTVRIGNWAEAYDVALAPHCPVGPIALAACLRVDAVCHDASIQEQSRGIHYNAGGEVTDNLLPGHDLILRDGFLHIPTGPGLGIEVDEAAVKRAAQVGHRWRAPLWRHRVGSIAGW
ncbi:enolase C-terminal domain-like protein [Rubellimicrobium roseum]|uniref:enolase C-terminal domain-like protein n=1 Tax=Rubellimicrobium roseum TaxID=687525 RepID=UPI001C3F480C|nr:enolase C-terminal domain-like protein [Rubellimicrobium roseum]